MVIGEVEEASVYTNKAGEASASLEVTATTVKFLDGRELGSETATAQKVAAPVGKRALSEEDIPF